MVEKEKKRFRLYVDESGDHTFNLTEDDNHRYLGLLGVWFDSEAPYREFARALGELKKEIFGWHPDDPPICFHRSDIVKRKNIFVRLRDTETNKRFEGGLLKLIGDAQFCMTCVVLDKAAYRAKPYREPLHPYHYCIAALLERYAGWLSQTGAEGDVIAESRGRNEDQELLEAFEVTLQKGTRFHDPQGFQQVLTSTKIKLKKKEHAVPGLELADLLAYPIKREMVTERRGERPPNDFGSALLDAARPKMNCQLSTRQVAGYGKVWLD